MKTTVNLLLLPVLAAILATGSRSARAQNATNVTELIRLSQQALSAQTFKEAEHLAKQAVSLDPAYPPAWRQYGLALWQGGDPKAAIPAFQRAVNMDEKDATAWRGLAQAYWQTDQQNESVHAASTYLRLKPEDASGWRDLATWLTRLNRGEEAVAALQRVVQLNPENASAWRELGSWLSRLERFGPAVEALKQRLKYQPDDAAAWRDLATALTRLNRHEEAVAALRRVTSLDPKNASVWRELASALIHLENHSEAAEALQQEVALDPDNAAAWRELATELTRLKRDADAIRALQRSLSLKADNPHAWRELGLLHQRSGETDETVKAFEKTLALSPDDAATHRDLGWLLWTKGQREAALRHLTQAVENPVENRDQVVLQVVARLAEEGEEDQAIAFLRRADPNAPLSEMGLELARKGRLKAAGPILKTVWAKGEKTLDIGLYLAYSRAINGQFAELSDHLKPLMASPAPIATEHGDLALDLLRLASAQPNTADLLAQLEPLLKQNAQTQGRVTEVLEAVANTSRTKGRTQQALSLYRRVLDRDPNRKIWIFAFLLAEKLEGPTSLAWLKTYAQRVSDPACQTGIQGVQADRLGQTEQAVASLRNSLSLDPAQATLRQLLFQCLLAQGRVDEAREEIAWFTRRIDAGENDLRSYQAEMLTRIGDDRAALPAWERLHQISPESTYYAIELADALFRLGRPEEAVGILQPLVGRTRETKVFDELAEIASAQAHYDEAVIWSEQGLALSPSPNLLRYQAESLEAIGTNAPTALADARLFLKSDPGNVPMTLLAGRMLEQVGATNELMSFHQTQLDRNPVFVPSLLALRNTVTRHGEIDEAVTLAKRHVDFQPGNPEVVRAYANSLAQQDHFHQALNLLKPLARTPLEQALPILVYDAVVVHPYAGRNTVDQLKRHIKLLDESGYRFVNTFDTQTADHDRRRVIIVLIDPEPDVIEALDPVLIHHNACVVYAGNAAIPSMTLSGHPIPARLSQALASGRWRLASGGPADHRRLVVTADGVLGNPLTHPLITADGKESPQRFAERLDRSLSTACGILQKQAERILVYPSGDFGNRSLNTDTNNVAILRHAVSRHFTHAVYFDESGFYLTRTESDPLRVPARQVPPQWDETALAAYLGTGHPLTRARLELARVLYWDGQHEAAHAAFAEAAKAGADRRELLFNQGMNAERQGDLPTARATLLAAQALDPESERIRVALNRLEDRRRPQATAFLSGWRDNEDRDHYRYGAFGDISVSERIRLGLMLDRDRWSTDGVGTEYGTRYGLRGLAYLAPQIWLSGRLWWLDMASLDDHWGGDIALRLPNPLLSGYLMVTASREEIETVEALRENIDANSYALRTYTRLYDVFDLFADLSQIDRSDGNDTTMLDGRLLYRLHEWPYIGAGWRFRFANSDRDPPEYWAPEGLQQHQAHITVRGASGRWSYAASAEAGYAKESDTSWRFVWGTRGTVDYTVTRRLNLSGELGYFESPDYNRTFGRIAVTGRF